MKYVLVTAARNEERYIRNAIETVASQTILPHRWVIVSDGSTDGTEEIIFEYIRQLDFLSLVRRKGDLKRNFGSQVRAINAGIAFLEETDPDFDFIGNLDADISLERDYFERILVKFQQETKLGLAGGYIHELKKARWEVRPFNSVSSVPHAVQLFRACVFREIGGYPVLKYGGPDWYAEVAARIRGYEVKSFPEIRVFHHRPTLKSEGSVRGAFRQGLMDYSLGSHPVFEVFKCLKRVFVRPLLLYSFARLGGFVWSCMIREDRIVSKEFVDALRTEQIQRVKAIINF
jgi:glycosyltransferase involved in cell wall biosynthesis